MVFLFSATGCEKFTCCQPEPDLAGEGGAGQQLAGRGPQVADVRPGVGAGLVEADPGDDAEGVRLELDAHLDRGRVTRVGGRRGDVGSPDRARAGHVDRGARPGFSRLPLSSTARDLIVVVGFPWAIHE